MTDAMLQLVQTYVLVLFRVGAMMLFAPLFGSNRIPRRVRGLLAIILAVGLAGGVRAPERLPGSTWELAMGIGGEMAFGLAMGMVLSFVFIAAQWAGEIIGQQMGLNMSEVFDPQFGTAGSVVGDMYFMLALIIFLTVPPWLGGPGHHAMLRGLFDSFQALPLLSVGVNADLLDILVGLFHSTTTLAIQLAAPMLVTMLVVDVALGFVSKTVPQINIMTAGVTVRSVVGFIVLLVGLMLTSDVLRTAILESMTAVRVLWTRL